MSKRKKIGSIQSQQGLLTSYFKTDTNCVDNSGNKERKKEIKEDRESRFIECPICLRSIPKFDIQRHAEYCQGDKTITSVSSSPEKYSNDQENRSSFLCSEKTLLHNKEPLPGLYIYENFISEKEEQEIISALDSESSNPWKSCTFNGLHLGKRWGVHCNLRSRRVDAPQHPLPSFIQNIIMPKLLSLLTMKGCVPNESNAIDYRKRDMHYLKAHVDDRQLSKESIANLSLAGDCIMTFRNVRLKQNDAQNNGPVKVLLKRRTLQILSGKARYDFSHGIEYDDILSARRISLTMRESPLTKTTAINLN